MGKKIKKVFKKVDPFTAKVTDRVLGDMGLPNVSGYNANRESAEAQAEQTRLQQEMLARQAETMQSNFAADLKGENLANVVAGGSAELAGMGMDPTKKRRPGGLTSALGV